MIKIKPKEWYINVYKKKNGDYWYGIPYMYPYYPYANLRRQIVYRIHVRLK